MRDWRGNDATPPWDASSYRFTLVHTGFLQHDSWGRSTGDWRGNVTTLPPHRMLTSLPLLSMTMGEGK